MAACRSPKPLVGVQVPAGTPTRKKKMIEVLYNKVKIKEFEDLNEAMAWAKVLDKFVTIQINGYEIVGKFGADSVIDGKCPDGIAYDWKKRRI